METLVRNNFMEHLISVKLLVDAQHGFVRGRSCVTQLIETIEVWTQKDKGNSVDTVSWAGRRGYRAPPGNQFLSDVSRFEKYHRKRFAMLKS